MARVDALLSVPTMNLLELWSELEQALHGTSGYGSDTAEIYAYRFAQYTPAAGMIESHKRAADIRAAQCLHALIALFVEKRGARAHVNGRAFGRWVASVPFDHRAHVRVRPRKPRTNQPRAACGGVGR